MSTAIRREPSGAPHSLHGGANVVGDIVFSGICRTAAASVIVLALVMIAYIVMEAWPAIEQIGWGFFGKTWDPRLGEYGSLPFIYGTVWTSTLAMMIAVPFGVATAAFLAEIAPPLVRKTGSFLIELLAAIPSVVYGFWAIKFLAPLTKHMFLALGAPANVDGDNMFTAGLVLAVMILPYITAITFDVSRAVPRSQREGSLALGATRWQTIWNVVLPYARPGIFGGCFLALGRALGETMAVLMVIGNVPQISFAPYAPGATIPTKIASALNEVGGLQRSALVELGAVLLLVTIVVNCLARLMIWRMGRAGQTTVLREILQDLFWRKLLPCAALLFLAFLSVRVFVGVQRLVVDGWEVLGLTILVAAALLGVGWGLNAVVLRSSSGSVWVNRLMTAVLAACLVVTCGPLFLILGYIAANGISALDLNFFLHLPNDPQPGLAHAIVGSLILVLLASLLAVPLGLLAAIFLAENPNSQLTKAVRFVGEMLGGVPSIVIGIFGYALLVMPGGWLSLGEFTAWAGAFALGLMMIPIVMRGSEEALKLVPEALRHASYALGAARWQTVLRVTVPAALPTIITGVCLAIARIAGETAPLLLTVNQTAYWPETLNQDFPYLTYYIYYGAMSTRPEQNRLAWAAAFVLLTVVMLVNVGIRLLTGRRALLASRAD
jgi:phosphate transport system permease protein